MSEAHLSKLILIMATLVEPSRGVAECHIEIEKNGMFCSQYDCSSFY